MDSAELITAEAHYLVGTYVRPPVVFTHGEGAYLYDSEGRRYLDFAAGIAVNALGHGDPDWVAAVREQAGLLTHISNLYHTAPHVALAQRLVTHSFADRIFFCNSGSEANETALKFARKVARMNAEGAAEPFSKSKIVAFSASFHGRTMGALSTTSKTKYRAPFEPLVPGVTFVPFNDLEAATAAVDGDTCAVIVEPIQGEGGVNLATPEFLRGLRSLCDQHSALLIFDEVQCGLGRSGTLWAHEAYGVTPDIMTLAKPLAGGLPIGATLVTEAVAQAIQPGDHGSTFAAGPLVCRAAAVVFDRVSQPAFLAAVRQKSLHLQAGLHALESDHIMTIRGRGLLLGMVLDVPATEVIAAARKRGLLVINAGEDVLRLCPPLIISREQIDDAVAVLAECLAEVAD